MTGRNNSRTVKVTITSEGEVKRTRDPNLTRPFVFALFPQTGPTYGWDIEPHINSGSIRRPVLASDTPVAPNESGKDDHQNTLQTQGAHFVKLDVGYWGNYDEDRKPDGGQPQKQLGRQRNFGIIEGENAWLCSYEAEVSADNSGGIMPDAGTLADGLFQALAKYNRNIKLLFHATIPTVKDGTPDKDKIYICFPDVHLPEQWPDLYPVAKRAQPGYRRAALRRLLRRAQEKPGPSEDSLLTQAVLDKLQDALDGWAAGGSAPLDLLFDVSTSDSDEVSDGDTDAPIPNGWRPIPPWSKDEVLAEKAHLDREIQGRSAWFYLVSVANNTKVKVTSPFAAENDPPQDYPADDPVTCEVESATDLANFLFVLSEFKKTKGDAVKVIQVGDLYELWMNREFMYKDAPVLSHDELAEWHLSARGLIGTFETAVPLLSTGHKYPEAYQLREDPDWTTGARAHPAKHYVYHGWPRKELYHRHDTRGKIPGAAAARMGKELLRRIRGVEAWSHRHPDANKQTFATHPDLIQPLKDFIASKPANFCVRTNLRGETELCWHRVVLQLLLEDIGADVIHGNHDGYRSDTQLLPSKSGSVTPAPDMAESQRRMGSDEWISEPGVWIEHGHRWDFYNRDGVALGAGMTNIVYYHNHELIKASNGFLAQIQKQEQALFQPGSAQWFLLVNYGQRVQWYTDKVKPFGVFVSGHTHVPDLVKIFFELSLFDEVAEALGEAVHEAEAAATEAVEKMKAIASGVPDMARAAAHEAANAVSSAANTAVETVKSAANGVVDTLKSVGTSLMPHF